MQRVYGKRMLLEHVEEAGILPLGPLPYQRKAVRRQRMQSVCKEEEEILRQSNSSE